MAAGHGIGMTDMPISTVRISTRNVEQVSFHSRDNAACADQTKDV